MNEDFKSALVDCLIVCIAAIAYGLAGMILMGAL